MLLFCRIGVLLIAAIVLSGAHSLRSIDSRRSTPALDPAGVIVHEWGTFTSVAALDGTAVEWIPQQGPSDLPCFVDRARMCPKCWLRARVRMETPVLYFYSAEERTLDVRVRFRQGVMTEWYPPAAVVPGEIKPEMLTRPDFAGEISWRQVKVLPRAAPEFPSDSTSNHYYAARATDAAPVQVGSKLEKFLFYRGIANFEPPLQATIGANGSISVRTGNGQSSIGDVMLFENRGGFTAHAGLHSSESQARLPALAPGRAAGSAAKHLEDLLVSHGLYRREAQAMVETWRDSWFEEGTRLFYIASQQVVDDVLPLEISPAPSSVARVFVGRLELLTSETIDDVKSALAKRDRAGLLKHRRFLGPIMARIHPQQSPEAQADWQFVYNNTMPASTRACR